MKSLKILLLSFFMIAGFASCENHMDIRDIEKGTPTNADSALAPSLHQPFTPEELEAHKETLPKVYRR